MKTKLYLAGGLLLLVLIFALQNLDGVELRFLVWKVSMSRALLVVVLYGLGLFTGWIMGAIARRPRVP